MASLEVLVVDDDFDARDTLALAVRSFGYSCRVAVDGDDALRAIADKRADVIISDWDMPQMSGAELCRRIRARHADAFYTYFILLTGFADREHVLAATAAGADDYQSKPVELDALHARLAKAAQVVELRRTTRAKKTS